MMKNNMKKASILVLTALLICMLTLPSCGSSVSNSPGTREQASEKTLNDPILALSRNYDDYTRNDESWAVYWYLCGSDLESGGGDPERGGAGTIDLQEMLKVELPSDVKVVIETGGARNWKNDVVSADELGRYVYEGSELRRVDSQPLASMGDPNTFASFLDFCNREYPAEHQVVILWDHGGGSLFGAQSDELFGSDKLTLPEMRAVFNGFPAASGMYEIVGFDACLMATIDVADVLDEHARYLVASEDVEPLLGWNYTALFEVLASDFEVPLTGADLGGNICEGYFKACAERGLDVDATLSVIDLSKFPALLEAYNKVGDEALVKAMEQKQDFYSAFERAAYNSESYGIISGKVSAFDMVDLGDLMRNAAGLLEGEEEVLAALNDCVVHNMAGPLRSKASGLACYFIYSGAQESLDIFSQIGTSRGFQYFYEYPLKGSLSHNGLDYINALSGAPVPAEPFPIDGVNQLAGHSLREPGQNDIPNAGWVLDLGPELVRNVSEMTVVTHYALWDNANNRIQSSVMLGYDTNYSGDWQTGKFQDGFNGYWYNLNGILVPVMSDKGAINMNNGDAYWTLRIPILLNGERYTLEVHHTGKVDDEVIAALQRAETVQIDLSKISNEKFEVYGARRYSEPGEPPSKELRSFEPGDVIQPLFEVFEYDYSTPDEGDGEATLRGFETITLGVADAAELKFTREYLGEGYFYTAFKTTDLSSVQHFSALGWYLGTPDGFFMGSFDNDTPTAPASGSSVGAGNAPLGILNTVSFTP